MTLQPGGAIAGKRYALEDTGGLVCLECYEEFRGSINFAKHVKKCPGEPSEEPEAPEDPPGDSEGTEGPTAEPVARPEDDSEALPPGYEYLGAWRGGYGIVGTPDGRELAGPDNGKFHGKSDGADAAWVDFLEGEGE